MKKSILAVFLFASSLSAQVQLGKAVQVGGSGGGGGASFPSTGTPCVVTATSTTASTCATGADLAASGAIISAPTGSQTITQPANTAFNVIGTQNVNFDATTLPATTVQPDLTRTPFGVAESWPYEFVTMQGVAPSQIYTYNISTGVQVAVGSPTSITSCVSANGLATTNIAGANILAAYCGDTATLYTYSIASNGALTALGTVAGLASSLSKTIVIDGTDVYIPLSGTSGTSTGSVAKVSIATPASPSITAITAVASYAFGGSNAFQNPVTVQVAGNYVYVNTGNSDGSVLLSNTLQVLNKSTMALVGSPLPINHSSQRLAVQGNVLFLTTYDSPPGILTSFDISNPSAPVVLQKLAVASCHEEAIAVRGSTLWISCYDNAEKTIKQLDVSNPSNMRLLNTYANFNFGETMLLSGLNLIMTSSSNTCATCGFIYLAHTQGLEAQRFSSPSAYVKSLAAQMFSTSAAAVTNDLHVQGNIYGGTASFVTNADGGVTLTNFRIASGAVGIGGFATLAPGILGTGAHVGNLLGTSLTDGNYSIVSYMSNGSNVATNCVYLGMRNIGLGVKGLVVSNTGTVGVGYSENDTCPTTNALTVNGNTATTSVQVNGGTVLTSQSSANSQLVTCATGGTGTQYCGADGAWHAAAGSGTVSSIATTSPITGGTITTTGTIACPTCGVTGSGLNQFASTTSAQLAGVISDETGSGPLVFATSPTLVTPALGTPASGVVTNLTGTGAFSTTGQAGTVNTIAGNVSFSTGLSQTGAGTIASPYVVTSTATGTVTSVSGTANQINSTGGTTPVLSLSSTLALPGTISSATAGAVSTSAAIFTGAPFTGGSGTTTFPYFYLNSGAAPTTWSTSGTMFGINAPSGFAGFLLDFRANGGASLVNFASNGAGSMRSLTINSLAAGFNSAGSGTVLHLIGMGTAPTIAAGTGAGTTPTVALVTATDLSGYITVTTGTTPTASAAVVTVTFNTVYAAAPKCSASPSNVATQALTGIAQAQILRANTTTALFVLTQGATALAASTAYEWSYSCGQ